MTGFIEAALPGSHRYHLVPAAGTLADLDLRAALCGTRPVRGWVPNDDLLPCGRCVALHKAVHGRGIAEDVPGPSDGLAAQQ